MENCLIVSTTPASPFEYVREWDDEFLRIFPHRFDYIWAEHPSLNAQVQWKTESRHPLSDRLIRQGSYLYGVRFGAETNYCLIDIDIGSLYHPRHDPLAVSRIVAALEPLGLVNYLACTSSYSDGLHLYFPFQQPQSSWQLAIVVACLLENTGFKIQPGQLEIFPNPKPYIIGEEASLFNAHRLPLQVGSYLLNDAFQPIWSNTETFVKRWQPVQKKNSIDAQILKQTIKQAKRRHLGISGKAEKFINDLNAEIELGWTGPGQTNRLLGRITMRAYIFHHILAGGTPLEGKALIDEIVKTACSLPGYCEWCRHQHEIEQRAEEWARCIENSHYFHFGDLNKKAKPENQNPELATAIDQSPSWNQRQSAAARDRIKQAIADLLEKNSLPIQATARFQSLLKYGIGGASLYRHRDLWHPNHLQLEQSKNQNDELDQEPNTEEATDTACEKATDNCPSPPSLFHRIDGDNAAAQGFSIFSNLISHPDDSNISMRYSNSEPLQGVQYVQQALFELDGTQEAFQEAARLARSHHRRIKSEAAEQRQIDRMQQFLDSGDPILVAEAIAWAQVNPGVLNSAQLQLPFSDQPHSSA